jgi:hypothetical protein
VFTRGWEAFSELVPKEIAAAVFAIDRPVLLAEQLGRCQQTLVHGDMRLGNLRFFGDRIVLIDWGERVGTAPPVVELGWFIGFDAMRLDVSKEDVIADFRVLHGERFEETALQLSLIGSLVQLGGPVRLLDRRGEGRSGEGGVDRGAVLVDGDRGKGLEHLVSDLTRSTRPTRRAAESLKWPPKGHSSTGSAIKPIDGCGT